MAPASPRIDPRKAEIVELRSFGGLSVEEVAATLDLSEATVKREWSVGRIALGLSGFKVPACAITLPMVRSL
ncbi:MAG TPA: ECF-type sigma factor [Bryobacteraceae bacterium]|nr:ECF-type sigma factor [Bryobacteraceae bacterium]